jgi:ADP-heptose:LPS heptosyltransferase
MHIAAIAKTKLVALMGNTRPEIFGPYRPENNVTILDRNPSCSPCSRVTCPKFSGHSCVQDIGADEIIAAVKALIENSPANARQNTIGNET